jgi:hypothetical protein
MAIDDFVIYKSKTTDIKTDNCRQVATSKRANMTQVKTKCPSELAPRVLILGMKKPHGGCDLARGLATHGHLNVRCVRGLRLGDGLFAWNSKSKGFF